MCKCFMSEAALKHTNSFVSALLGKGLVSIADVEAAIQEMFQAPHIQVSWNLLCADSFPRHFKYLFPWFL